MGVYSDSDNFKLMSDLFNYWVQRWPWSVHTIIYISEKYKKLKKIPDKVAIILQKMLNNVFISLCRTPIDFIYLMLENFRCSFHKLVIQALYRESCFIISKLSSKSICLYNPEFIMNDKCIFMSYNFFEWCAGKQKLMTFLI